MKKLGEKLRSQRLAKGIQLSRIAEETRISTRYLEALENGDTKVLPGSMFAKSFARQYARFVGLDETEIEADLGVAFPPENNVPTMEAVRPSPPIHVAPLPDVVGASSSLSPQLYRSAVALLLVVAACSAVYMVWQRRQAGMQQEQAAYRSPVVAPIAEPEPPAAAPSGAVAAPAASTEASPAAGGGTEGGRNASIELNVPEGTEGMAVQVVASERTWVSITVNGRSVFSGVLEPNESRTLSRVERARMVIGNAGGVDVIADGKSIGPIGPPGQVRFVLLSPEGPRILTKREIQEQKARANEGTS